VDWLRIRNRPRAELGSLLLPLVLSACLSGCGTTRGGAIPRAGLAPSQKRVWLASNGFHSSVAVPARLAPLEVRKRHPAAKVFAIGWGSRGFYTERAPGWYLLFTALFLPTRSALHVVPLDTPPETALPNSAWFEFPITSEGEARLRLRLDSAFLRDTGQRLRYLGVGKFAGSSFWDGSEVYLFPRTCNVWVASVLKSAGVRFVPWCSVEAGVLMRQGRRLGIQRTVVGRPKDPL
jgi:uncharacterized protein (TIGR02117 family)